MVVIDHAIEHVMGDAKETNTQLDFYDSSFQTGFNKYFIGLVTFPISWHDPHHDDISNLLQTLPTN